jgi:spore photoproduct lyase
MASQLLFESLQKCYQPRAAPHFVPEKIILTKGSNQSPEQFSLTKSICRTYSKAQVIEQPNLPHNRIEMRIADPIGLHYSGKRTLVLGIHKSAVQYSKEGENTCPNYWHFSCYGFCPYDCQYCYLAGTPGVKYSPSVKIFLNLHEVLDKINSIASKYDKPVSFYLGKLQDGLALDPVTGYSRTMVPFFAEQKNARLIILTKGAKVNNLLDINHKKHTYLSWSLNPHQVCSQFERNVPAIDQRISAMQKCAKAGYPLRAVIMPIIPLSDWRDVYAHFIEKLLKTVPLERITLGQICSFSAAKSLMELKLGKNNLVSNLLSKNQSKDGRFRFPLNLRIKIYNHLIKIIRTLCPDLQIGLCLEEPDVFESLNMTEAIGRCNCVL